MELSSHFPCVLFQRWRMFSISYWENLGKQFSFLFSWAPCQKTAIKNQWGVLWRWGGGRGWQVQWKVRPLIPNIILRWRRRVSLCTFGLVLRIGGFFEEKLSVVSKISVWAVNTLWFSTLNCCAELPSTLAQIYVPAFGSWPEALDISFGPSR